MLICIACRIATIMLFLIYQDKGVERIMFKYKSKNSQKTERLFTGRISNQTSCSQTDYLQMGEKFVRSRR